MDQVGVAEARKALAEKRFEDAVKLLDDLHRESPDEPEVLSLLAAAHAECKDYPQALAYFAKAASLSPSARAHFNVASVHRLLHDNARAKQSLLDALKQDPRYERARRMLAEMDGTAEQRQQESQSAAVPQTPAPPTNPTLMQSRAPSIAVQGHPEPTVYGTPAQTTVPPPRPAPLRTEIVRNWPKVIGGGIMVGVPFVFVWGGWASSLSAAVGTLGGVVIGLAIAAALAKWLADNAGAYETWHYVIMIFATGLLPALLMIKASI